jgi:ABC-2 type transport system permease protein
MTFTRVLGNEINKEMITTFSYKSQWFGEFLSLVIFYLFLSQLPGKLELSILSYSLWFYSILIVGDVAGKISSEMRLGTLEQIYLSTYSVIYLLLAKIIASIVRSCLLMFSLLFLLSINNFIDFIYIPDLLFFLALLIITPGLFGISLLIGGLTLLIKDASWIINIVNNSMLFLSGIFLSLETFPIWVQKLSFAMPTTQAITLIHRSHFLMMDWLITLFSSLIYFLFGLTLFLICEKKAKSKGVLGHY